MARGVGHPPLLRRTTSGANAAVQALLFVAACLYLGRLATADSFGVELLALLVVVAVALSLAIRPHVFVALALVVFGTFSLSRGSPLDFGGTLVYSTDILLALVLLRAVVPRERVRPSGSIGVAALFFGAWAAVMVVAGLRGWLAGYELASVIRLETPLLYSLGFYLGLARIVRERGFELDKAVRNLLIVALGFVAYMVVARVTNSPFETDETVGRLGPVITTAGELRRDYGFATAFILYPALALGGAAYLFYGSRRTLLATVAVSIGILATLVTLIRGEIFGLVVGLALIAVLRNAPMLRSPARVRAILAGGVACVLGGVGLWIVEPTLVSGAVERSLPGLVAQSETAERTADFRLRATESGFEAVRHEPFGVGLLPEDAVTIRSGVEYGYIGHSGVTRTLAYTGWPGLAATVLALLGLLWASFRLPRPVPWLHPFFIGSVVMLSVYSFSEDGLVGEAQVIGLAALIAALRFHARRLSA